jgi:hypothetical protein
MIDPEQIRQATEEVLRSPAYREIPGSLWNQGIERLLGWIAELVNDTLATSTAGRIGQLVALAVVALVLVLLVSALLGLRRRGVIDIVVDDVSNASRAELMEAADDHRAAGRMQEAVRARYGALVVLLAERDVLLARPSTTVGEVDAIVGSVVPTAAADVTSAGRALAEVVYGHRAATLADDRAVQQALRTLDRSLDTAARQQ